MEIILACALLAAGLAMAVWLAFSVGWSGDRLVRLNLTMGFKRTKAEEIRSGPDYGWAKRFTTDKGAERLNKIWAMAGRPAEWPIARLTAMKPIALASVTVVMLLLLSLTGFSRAMLLAAFVTIPVSYFLPELLLYSKGKERQTTIGLELPDTLDQMMIAVDAGLGFEAAMSRAAENGTGPLAGELARTLQEMRVGIPRREAYAALEKRTEVPDLRSFTRAVVQADAYGISISDVLRTQADEMRMKRKQRAEETAMKIPTKIVMPLMLFILPVLFLVILGPMAIDIFMG